MNRRALGVYATVILSTITACATAASPTPPALAPAPPQLTAAPLTQTPTVEVEKTGTPNPGQETNMTPLPTVQPELQSLVDQATADLAQRLAIDPAGIEVVSAQSVVWPDSSLGCPQPGMAYLQVLTEGTRIELRVDDRPYAYHIGGRRGLFLCENPAP